MRILLLGAGGFIGSKLSLLLSKSHQVKEMRRGLEDPNSEASQIPYDLVVNCAASLPSASRNEARISNFSYPKRVIEEIEFKSWVQIESYYQLEIPHGRNDPYTLEKQRFSDYLSSLSYLNSDRSFYHLYLPHVFGEGERSIRLIRNAIESFRSGERFSVKDGKRFIPILHIEDAVNGISAFLENPINPSACTPFWYGTINDLIETIRIAIGSGDITRNDINDSEELVFRKVEFPPAPSNWSPKMRLPEFVEWVVSNNA